MNSPTDWLLVIKHEDGTKGYINLWEAIEQGRLIVKTNPLNRARVTDACADTPEYRYDVDTDFGAKQEDDQRKAWLQTMANYPKSDCMVCSKHDYLCVCGGHCYECCKCTPDDLPA